MKEEWGKWGIFEGAVVNGRRADVDAGPYGEATRSAVRRADVGVRPYGEVTRSAVRRADVGIGPYGGFHGVQGYIGWNYRVRLG